VLRYIYLDFPDAACDMCKKCDNMHLWLLHYSKNLKFSLSSQY
jgi:hypothetical protein